MALGEVASDRAPTALVAGPRNSAKVEGGGGAFPPPSLQQWVPDERDAFLAWLRGEFAAANAIIDSLCYHLRDIGQPGEYDLLLACIQQRRYNWTLVLHMQQYFSVAEVQLALQQVAWQKKQPKNSPHVNPPPPPPHPNPNPNPNPNHNSMPNPNPIPRSIKPNNPRIRRQNSSTFSSSPITFPPLQIPPADQPLCKNSPSAAENAIGGVDAINADLPSQQSCNSHITPSAHSRSSSPASVEDADHAKLEKAVTEAESGKGSFSEPDLNAVFHFSSKEDEDSRHAMVKASKCICNNEQGEEVLVQHVEGLELYENVFNHLETTQLVHSVDNYEIIGRKEDSCDGSLKPMPSYLQVVVDRLLSWKILPASKSPSHCSIKVLDEGSQVLPPMTNHEIEHPFCILSLLPDCTMCLGDTSFNGDGGDFNSAHKLQLPAGSVLIIQGNSTELAKFLPASKSRRILITLAKMVPKVSSNHLPSDKEVSQDVAVTQQNEPNSTSLGVTMMASPSKHNHNHNHNHNNHHHHHMPGILHHPHCLSPQKIPASGATLQPLSPNPNGSYPAVMGPAWPAVTRGATARPAALGTGVFFPSSNGPNRPLSLTPQPSKGVGFSSSHNRTAKSNGSSTHPQTEHSDTLTAERTVPSPVVPDEPLESRNILVEEQHSGHPKAEPTSVANGKAERSRITPQSKSKSKSKSPASGIIPHSSAVISETDG